MKRRMTAVFGAGLLVLVTASAVMAAGPKSAFTGTWISTDTDGSTQRLKVASGNAPAVIFQDFYESGCEGAGSVPTHWTSNGRGTVDGDTLFVWFRTSGCGAFSIGEFGLAWDYDAGTDTLTDGVITWYRFP